MSFIILAYNYFFIEHNFSLFSIKVIDIKPSSYKFTQTNQRYLGITVNASNEIVTMLQYENVMGVGNIKP